MSERETGAQSEQVTCHKRNDDEVRGPHWECKLPGVKGGWVLDPPFCPTCGTGLRADGTEQARVDKVTPEAVRGTRLWRVLSFIGERPRSDGELEAAGFGEVGSLLELSDWGLIGARDDSLWHLTDEGRIIYAALSQGGLAAAEPSAEVADAIDAVRSFVAWYEKHHGFLGDVTPEAFEMVIAAALAATGAAQGDGDTALMDALKVACDELSTMREEWGAGTRLCPKLLNRKCAHYRELEDDDDSPQLPDAKCSQCWREVCEAGGMDKYRALLAQAGGADRG